MANKIKSPNSFELQGTPKLGARFGKKAGFIVGSVLAIAIGLIIYGIATREGSGTAVGEDEKRHLTPAITAGKRLYEGVGDGILGREEPTPIIINSPQTQQSSGSTETPIHPPEDLDARQAEEAAARLREQREQERRRAVESGSAVNFDNSNTLAATSSSDQELREATYQKMLANSKQGQIGTSANSLTALKSGALGSNAQNDQNLQARKELFLAAAAEQQADESLRGTRRLSKSAYELKASTVIPAVLLTGLNSDLPGEIIGQISENIFDTATGRHLLIPQGARVYGRYDSQVAFGQSRALIAWDRLIFPDGSSITLQGMGGADKSGYSGFKDQVNNHIGRLIGYGILSSAFASAFQISQRHQQEGKDGVQSPQQVAAGEVARQFSQLGIQMTQKNLNIQPTIEIRPGYQFVVMVNRDMIFQEAYKDRSK